MRRYVVRRVLLVIPVMLGVSLIVFLLMHFTPGDPALLMLGERATEEQLQLLRQEMGLLEPLPVQYARFLGAALQGDLGRSYRSGRPVMTEVLSRLPATAELAVAAVVIAVLIGVPVGVLSAVKQYSLLDNAGMLLALLGASLPSFWLGLMLMLLFAVNLGWLPPSGRDGLSSLVLPALTLGAGAAALITRMTRSSMLEVINQDYVRTARAKGLPEKTVIYSHAFRNALLPVVTVIGLQFGALLGGAVITETVFAWPGAGRLAVEAIRAKDYPVVQGAVLMLAFAFAIVNLLVDLLYAFLNPRIRARYK
ncbi:MAG: Dipeptide transport system permease protein DppB [Syntrophomonadaceae bacterium]|nr:Dipeptide transport system permease protein DppB [Bacillota bacterium]